MQVRENLHKWKLHKRWEKKKTEQQPLPEYKNSKNTQARSMASHCEQSGENGKCFCIESFFSCPWSYGLMMKWWWCRWYCSHLPSTLEGQQFSINNPQPTHLTAGHVGCLASHCWPVWWWWLFSYNTLHSLTLKQWMSYPCLKQWNWEKQLGWKLSGLKTIKSMLVWKLNLDMGS